MIFDSKWMLKRRSERQKYEVERSLLPDAVRLERLVEMRSAAHSSLIV